MARTFNCGIGMVAIVPADRLNSVIDGLTASGETATRIGTVVADTANAVQLTNLQAAFGRN
jgi:phosphoribosylformylglycinamidine cyclo-ligase